MSKLTWDAVGDRLYETGTKKGVLFLQTSEGYGAGIAWNGLTGFSESPDGGDATDMWAYDIKYLSIRAKENFKGTITAYTFPDEFAQCDGTASPIAGMRVGQQARKPFGFSYVTTVGNDVDFEDHGYKIHLIYGATASPSSKDYKTINDSPEAIEFSWEITTTPVTVGTINGVEYKPTASIELDSTKLTTAQLTAIENAIYGVDAAEAVAATYKKATGAFQATGVDYYTLSDNTYTKVQSPSSTDFGDYYVIDTPAKDAVTASASYLPTPSQIYTILSNAS